MSEGDRGRAADAATWMRNAHIAVYSFMSVCALSGLSYVFYAAFGGQVVRAIAGAVVATGGVAVGFLALAAVRFGAMLVARTERIELLVSRLEALEQAMEVQGVAVDLARAGAGDPEKLVAASVGGDGFPRLVRPETPAPPQPSEEREERLRAMRRAKALQLREDFARLVRSRDYEGALSAGAQMVELFPESAMAREFQTLRPRLREGANFRKPARPASAAT
ncbi:MAG: hypothetical protein V2A79_00820 [Planctomycetota bacterium]